MISRRPVGNTIGYTLPESASETRKRHKPLYHTDKTKREESQDSSLFSEAENGTRT